MEVCSWWGWCQSESRSCYLGEGVCLYHWDTKVFTAPVSFADCGAASLCLWTLYSWCPDWQFLLKHGNSVQKHVVKINKYLRSLLFLILKIIMGIAGFHGPPFTPWPFSSLRGSPGPGTLNVLGQSSLSLTLHLFLSGFFSFTNLLIHTSAYYPSDWRDTVCCLYCT